MDYGASGAGLENFHPMFKSMFLAVVAAGLLAGCASETTSKWQLVWEDDFDGPIDSTTWSKIPRGKPEWAQKMSSNPLCYDVQDGRLILRAIVNPDETDSVKFLTGGLYTKKKRAFHGGGRESCGRLQGARGGWPALLGKPFVEGEGAWAAGGVGGCQGGRR